MQGCSRCKGDCIAMQFRGPGPGAREAGHRLRVATGRDAADEDVLGPLINDALFRARSRKRREPGLESLDFGSAAGHDLIHDCTRQNSGNDEARTRRLGQRRRTGQGKAAAGMDAKCARDAACRARK